MPPLTLYSSGERTGCLQSSAAGDDDSVHDEYRSGTLDCRDSRFYDWQCYGSARNCECAAIRRDVPQHDGQQRCHHRNGRAQSILLLRGSNWHSGDYE